MRKDIRFTENQTVVNLHEDKHFQTDTPENDDDCSTETDPDVVDDD